MEAEFKTEFPQKKDSSGLFRAIGIGFFLSSALLSAKNCTTFADNLKQAIYKDLDSEQFEYLSDQIDFANDHEMPYDSIISELEKETLQLQLELALHQLYPKLLASDQAEKEVEALLIDAERNNCLRPLAQKLGFALDIVHEVSGTCVMRVNSPAAYVRISITSNGIFVLIPHSYELGGSEELQYENFDKEYRDVIGVLAKSLGEVKTAGADCILMHSQLKHCIREAVKYDLPLDLQRLMLASDLSFKSACINCESQQGRVQLPCGHWKCHECVLVFLYNQSLSRYEPDSVSEVQLSDCCVLTSEQLCELLSTEELNAVLLEPTLSPQS